MNRIAKPFVRGVVIIFDLYKTFKNGSTMRVLRDFEDFHIWIHKKIECYYKYYYNHIL